MKEPTCACNSFQSTGKCAHTRPLPNSGWVPKPPGPIEPWVALHAPKASADAPR